MESSVASVICKFGSRFYIFDTFADHDRAVALYDSPAILPTGFEQAMVADGISFGLFSTASDLEDL